ncbi:GNAT family N-acetyltransferase [Patulibacter sp. NPDC049589]|uniref:GNAT family N-acetyltransferase n=1 Tax=Patulibacter sp. NPDC049589 TaxID=3154731 RepID=UPI0034202466
MQLRAATPADAEAIAGIEFAVAHHAYAELEPRRVVLLELEDLVGEWRNRLGPQPDRLMGECVARVAELGGRVVGAAAWLTAPGPPPPFAPEGRLTHLMVHPVAQNAGVGSALLVAAEDALRAVYADRDVAVRAQTQVHQDAWWATRFLEARGWTPEPDPPADVLPHPSWTTTL